jgi:hypothetical protein
MQHTLKQTIHRHYFFLQKSPIFELMFCIIKKPKQEIGVASKSTKQG